MEKGESIVREPLLKDWVTSYFVGFRDVFDVSWKKIVARSSICQKFLEGN